MNCPHCHQALESGAAFCGNCGQSVASPAPPAAPVVSGQSPSPPSSPIAQVLQNQQAGAAEPQQPAGPLATAGVGGVPSYAVALPGQHSRENKALLSLLFGIAGIIGALFMVALGLALGLAGIVMGTMSRASSKRGLSTAGLIVSGIAVLGSLALWTYAAKHFAQLSQNGSTKTHSLTTPAVAASHLSTPCYSTDFTGTLNVSNSTNSCDMAAFNGATLETSTNAYKVYANTSQTATAANLAFVAKPAIEKDIQTNLPSFTVTGEGTVEFAGSPAYAVSAANKAQGVSIVEAAVFHQVADGENLFILVHAANGNNADLQGLETQWQWK